MKIEFSKFKSTASKTETSHRIDFAHPPTSITANEFPAKLQALCQEIYDAIGADHVEATYRRALKSELENIGVNVASEVSIEIFYKGHMVGSRRADLIVSIGDYKAILELKCEKKLLPQHFRQLKFYMENFNIPEGFLINFVKPNIMWSPSSDSKFRCSDPFLNAPNENVQGKVEPIQFETVSKIPDESRLIPIQTTEIMVNSSMEIMINNARLCDICGKETTNTNYALCKECWIQNSIKKRKQNQSSMMEDSDET